ncbi:MAG: hypothetical protein ACYDH6_22335 [Acidimicrobiales bacterium]
MAMRLKQGSGEPSEPPGVLVVAGGVLTFRMIVVVVGVRMSGVVVVFACIGVVVVVGAVTVLAGAVS